MNTGIYAPTNPPPAPGADLTLHIDCVPAFDKTSTQLDSNGVLFLLITPNDIKAISPGDYSYHVSSGGVTTRDGMCSVESKLPFVPIS